MLKYKNQLLAVFLSALLVSLSGRLNSKQKQPEKRYNYTVWVGSAAFASGYDTDEYTLTNETVTFKKKDGMTKIVPVCGLLSIDENKAN